MNRKIIIKSDDFDREIHSFLTEVGADVPIEWNGEALDLVRNIVIEAYEKMGVTLEIDARPQFHFSSLPQKPQVGEISEAIVKKKGFLGLLSHHRRDRY